MLDSCLHIKFFLQLKKNEMYNVMYDQKIIPEFFRKSFRFDYTLIIYTVETP